VLNRIQRLRLSSATKAAKKVVPFAVVVDVCITAHDDANYRYICNCPHSDGATPHLVTNFDRLRKSALYIIQSRKSVRGVRCCSSDSGN
jgi:hypothetical protein